MALKKGSLVVNSSQGGGAEMDYSSFRQKVAEGSVEEVQIGPELITGKLKNGDLFSTVPVGSDPKLAQMLEDGGVAARVMMRDHAFSVPKDASGEALVFGKLVRETLSEEQVRHMAEESHSGQAPAAQEWRVDAAAVRIPGATQEADQAASS